MLFRSVVTFGAALKADNIGLGVEVVVVVSSGTVVVIWDGCSCLGGLDKCGVGLVVCKQAWVLV